MADELIDIYDENNEPLGISLMKSEAHAKGLWHRVVHVWVYNSKKDILLQLRSKNKDIFPGRWEISASGHVGAGEVVESAAHREAKEEIGLDFDEQDLNLIDVVSVDYLHANKILNREFCYAYLLKTNKALNEMQVQEDEVDEIRFFPAETLIDLLKKNPDMFVNYDDDYWIKIINKIRNL